MQKGNKNGYVGVEAKTNRLASAKKSDYTQTS